MGALEAHGFVISERQAFPTFTEGYASVYTNDLPVYVSADAVLHAIHRSFSDMLANVEERVVVAQLRALLDAMRQRLADGAIEWADAETRADGDLFVMVAASLLADEPLAPVAAADPAETRALYESAKAADGVETLELFGTERRIDLSQLEPRAHYTRRQLQPYFRAMMWLGRIDLRLVEAQPDGHLSLRRRQVQAAFALGELMGEDGLERWRDIAALIGTFMGPLDAMAPPGLALLLDDLGIPDASALDMVGDEQLAEAILEGGYGEQHIASHYMKSGVDAGTIPLSRNFALLGQRYTLDAHVLSNVVYDRAGGGFIHRLMPDPLDAAFAALGNDHAAALLEPELRTHGYAADRSHARGRRGPRRVAVGGGLLSPLAQRPAYALPKNPLIDIAVELEKKALEDEYFVKRRLYPNVDFYSGLIYQSMDLPMDMFPVLFAIGRTAGWLAQWEEMLTDSEQRIARPRQVYVGHGRREYKPWSERE